MITNHVLEIHNSIAPKCDGILRLKSKIIKVKMKSREMELTCDVSHYKKEIRIENPGIEEDPHGNTKGNYCQGGT